MELHNLLSQIMDVSSHLTRHILCHKCQAALRSCFNTKTRECLQMLEDDNDSNDEINDENTYEFSD